MSLGCLVLLLLVVMRVTLAFALYRGEKRAWVPWVLQMAITALLAQSGSDFELHRLVSIPLHVLNLDFDQNVALLSRCLLMVWFWLMPVGVYAWYMLRKRWSSHGMTWKYVLGAVLWHDRSARLYSTLMLLAVLALLAGLAMDMRMGCLVCVMVPMLSLRALSRHYGVEVKHIWMAAASMVVFYVCQDTAGVWRVALLAVSFVPVAWLCSSFYRQKGKLALTLASILYIGVLLPCLSVGNNPYACLNEARVGYYYVEPYRGVFVVEDKSSGKVGLRDRYGLLVRPEYDRWTWYGRRRWFGLMELRRNGYVMLYDICNNRLFNGDDTDHELQDTLCAALYSHMDSKSYAFDDRLEVTVRDSIKGRVVAHVRMVRNGGPVYYYDEGDGAPFISNRMDTLRSGAFECDTVCPDGSLSKHMMHGVLDVNRGRVTVYTVDAKSARDEQPQAEEMRGLLNAVASKLR